METPPKIKAMLDYHGVDEDEFTDWMREKVVNPTIEPLCNMTEIEGAIMLNGLLVNPQAENNPEKTNPNP